MKSVKRWDLFKLTKKVEALVEKLASLYPEARAELNYKNNFELLVAVILSAQCTDVRVNIITKELFKEAPDPEAMVALGIEGITELIRSCGMYNQKAKNLYLTSGLLLEKHGGQVPSSREALMELPGVGRKTANVVLSNAFGQPAIAVDTHVLRVSNRLGLAKGKDPYKVEMQLQKILPKKIWTVMHHRLILHGRYCCKARNPQCQACGLLSLCPRIGVDQ
ncbi:MAG TPA: endonuclease III [Clostridia bacterium]|nr:endonuclease III [Clostridia bacterium]